MGASPQFTEAILLAHFRRNKGERIATAKLVEACGGTHNVVFRALERLRSAGDINKHGSGSGRRAEWSMPSEAPAKPVAAKPAFRMKELSAQHVPSRDYDRIRPGSGDLLRVPSKHI